MNLRTLITCLVFAVCSSSASAAELSANVIVTTKGAELFKAWESNPPNGFTIIPVKVAKRGEFLSAIIMFTDCRADTHGNCNAAVDITTYDPNGEVYFSMLDGELWKRKPSPDAGNTQLGVDYMGLVIETNDPSGTYKVVATIRDLVSVKSIFSEATFKVE